MKPKFMQSTAESSLGAHENLCAAASRAEATGKRFPPFLLKFFN